MLFPENPVRGDTHTHDDTVFVYNGVNWDRSVIGSRNSTDYSGAGVPRLLERIATLETLLKNVLILE